MEAARHSRGAPTSLRFRIVTGRSRLYAVPEYLENPRRTIRAPLRCHALLTRASGAVKTTTEDIGAHGCRVEVPSPSPRGEIVGLALSWRAFDRTLRVNGTVAWASARAPWALGIAFLDECLAEASRWLDGLIAADPSVLAFRDPPPKRISMDAAVFLAPPPGPRTKFTDEEQRLLRAVRLGVPIRTLREMGLEKGRLARVLFALFSKQALTLDRAAAAQPGAWTRILAARPTSMTGADLDGDPATPTEIETFDRTREVTARTPAPGRRSGDLPAAGGAARPRSQEVQVLLNSGLAELELQRPVDALVYLRRALVLAPGDPEIAEAIARAAGRARGE